MSPDVAEHIFIDRKIAPDTEWSHRPLPTGRIIPSYHCLGRGARLLKAGASPQDSFSCRRIRQLVPDLLGIGFTRTTSSLTVVMIQVQTHLGSALQRGEREIALYT